MTIRPMQTGPAVALAVRVRLPAGRKDDREWLAVDHPERLELLRSGIVAREGATQLRLRGPVGGLDRGGRFELAEG